MTADSNGYVGFGGFRNALVVIGGTSYTPPNPLDLNSCWGELIASCQELEDHPLEQSLLLYAEMARN
ncbi:hypothetical protein [Veillonella sp.]|uniref:hypothetical protein n=1 Tax=Veillonella sp. TaxID=1926307 RepID=UPI0025FB521F|nr:hypothetical protein [Veillonella sp.]